MTGLFPFSLLSYIVSYSHGTNLQCSAVCTSSELTKIDVTGAPRSYVFFPCAQWTASANNHRARSIMRLAGDLVQDDVAAAARCTAAHWRDICTAIYGAVRSTRLYLYTTTVWCTCTLVMYTRSVYLSRYSVFSTPITAKYSNLSIFNSPNWIRKERQSVRWTRPHSV